MNLSKRIKSNSLFIFSLIIGVSIIWIGYLLTKSFLGIFFSIIVIVIGCYICAEALKSIPSLNKKRSLGTIDILIILGILNLLYFPYCLAVAGYKTLMIVTSVFNIVALLVIVFSFIIIYKSKFFKLKIILRFLFFTSVIAVCTIVTVISVGIFISQWIKYDFSTAVSNWELNSPGKFGEFMFMFVLPIFLESIYLLGYNSRNNVVVLRSFQYDEDLSYKNTIDKLINVCEIIKLKVMYIGNPNSLFNYISDSCCYFLPTTNWREEVSNLISSANLIFCYLGVSEGILWELFTHGKEWNKFIFYIDNPDLGNRLALMLENIEPSEYKLLFKISINHILPLVEENRGIVFMINNNECYYHDNLSEFIKAISKEEQQINQICDDSLVSRINLSIA